MSVQLKKVTSQARKLYTKGLNLLNIKGVDDLEYCSWIGEVSSLVSENLFHQTFGGQFKQLNTLVACGRAFKSRDNMPKIVGLLKGIQEYSESNNTEQGVRKMSNTIVFISHQHKDIDKADRIRDFLINTIGLDAKKDIFFQGRQSSGVGIEDNIDDDMRNALLNNGCYFIALFSEQYFQRIACMKELGGAWVLGRKIVAFVFKNDNESTVQKTVMDNSKDAIGNRLMILVEDQNKDNMVERVIEQRYRKALQYTQKTFRY